MAKGPNNHATKGSGGCYCCRCSRPLGESTKVQPFNVDGETFCPRCGVWWRMNQPEEQGTQGKPRFNSHQAAAGTCQFCEWEVITFGAQPGRQLLCSHCLKPGVIRVPLEKGMFSPLEIAAMADAMERAKKSAEEQS